MKHLLTLAITAVMSFQVMAADLTSQDVSQWLKAMPILKSWLTEHEDDLSANISDRNDPEVVFKESIAALKKAGLYEELNNKVKGLGYSSVEQWSKITEQVTFAWMSVEMDANKAQMDAAKAQYEALKANPDIPPAQKAMMEEMMAPALAMIALADKSSAADKAAVKPHQNEINSYFNSEE
ncbi:MAG TPA: hypothetical protein DIC30_02495 [Oceanospirillales bacterium]|nr:hypothetical protein [Oceanospirillales bacterium]|tara:strand:- start:985 stop:1527 length:543 start_codon:yes stop_codon:yes gene_type:complete